MRFTYALLAALLLTGLMIASPVLADPPAGRGQGHGRGDRGNQGNQNSQGDQGNGRFARSDWDIVRGYYAPMIASGHCPPGLAKKQNGCMPPGQARRWAMGRPVATGVWVPLDPSLVSRLQPLPSGYMYVRVDNDILTLATGTMIVIDAITNLGNR